MKHLIHTLEFEVRCPEENYALSLRHNFALTFQQQIEQVIEQVCSRYTSDEDHIRIDKLEVDLGNFSTHAFDATFREILLIKFEQGLVEKLRALPPDEQTQSAPQAEIELLSHFLLKGRLPWWADEDDIHFNEVVERHFFGQAEAIRFFLTEQLLNKQLWKRIALQLDKAIKSRVVAMFSELTSSEVIIVGWIKKIAETHPHLSMAGDWQEQLQTLLLHSAPELLQPAGSTSSLRAIFEAHAEQLFTSISEVKSAQIAEVLDNITDFPKKVQSLTDQKSVYENKVAVDENEKYVVKQAGIVLLAPFLKPFFRKLSLLEGSDWKDEASQHKAMHMLRFLCTGEQHCPEYQLSLEKLFCGVPLEEPIPKIISYSVEEMEEANLLLQSVIEHWQALKKTSVRGLRETFLKREGILTRKDGNWQLQVERKTVDVLLDKIPWGFSMVMLPWNDYLIYVEW